MLTVAHYTVAGAPTAKGKVGLLTIATPDANSFAFNPSEWKSLIALCDRATKMQSGDWTVVGTMTETGTSDVSHLTVSAGPGLNFVITSPKDGTVAHVLQKAEFSRFQKALARLFRTICRTDSHASADRIGNRHGLAVGWLRHAGFFLSSPRQWGAKRRAIIIGGSMSGLFSAAFLRQIGWDCDVYERSSVELVGRGAGITTHPELLEALEASGAGTRDLGIEVPKRIAIDRQGRVTAERPLRQILTSWDRLQRLLRATIDPAHYHLGWAFERVEQNGSGVRVHFNGGRVEDADILVGGDGIRSTVRGQVAPELQPIYAGYYIWRGAPNEADLSPRDAEGDLSAISCSTCRRARRSSPTRSRASTTICGPATAATISSGIASPTPRKLREMNVDENGTQHEFSVPPPLIRKDLIARDVCRRARDHAAGDARLRDDDQAALHHADLRFHRAAHRVRPRRHGRRCRRQRAPAHGLRRGQGRRRRRGAGARACATTTTSTRR